MAKNNWRGGRIVNPAGYVMVWQPKHPRAASYKNAYVFEHILIVERVLGYHLKKPHEVHHFNEIKSDNVNSNLIVCENRSYHRLLHIRAEAYRTTGDPNSLKCVHCKEWDRAINLVQYKGRAPFHRACEREYQNAMNKDRRLRA